MQDLEDLAIRLDVKGESAMKGQSFILEYRIQLAKAEQTSRLADAAEGILTALDAAMRPNSEEGHKRAVHINTKD